MYNGERKGGAIIMVQLMRLLLDKMSGIWVQSCKSDTSLLSKMSLLLCYLEVSANFFSAFKASVSRVLAIQVCLGVT